MLYFEPSLDAFSLRSDVISSIKILSLQRSNALAASGVPHLKHHFASRGNGKSLYNGSSLDVLHGSGAEKKRDNATR